MAMHQALPLGQKSLSGVLNHILQYGQCSVCCNLKNKFTVSTICLAAGYANAGGRYVDALAKEGQQLQLKYSMMTVLAMLKGAT